MELRGANRVRSPRGEWALDALGAAFAAQRLEPLGTPSSPVAFVCASDEEAVGAAAALVRRRVDGLLLAAERLDGDVRAVLAAGGYALQHPDGRLEAAPAGGGRALAGRVTLLTSGTTGTPKLVPHDWDSLFTLRRPSGVRPLNWLLTYQLGTYAWFQMVTMALFVADQDLLLAGTLDPASALALAGRLGATAISSTPTFWRYAWLTTPAEVLEGLAFRQVTLGGERVDRVVLDRLRAAFPDARLSHIYASTEVGAAIVVNDGREGFPAAWLVPPEAPPDPGAVQLRVEGGTLRVRSPHASRAHSGWVDTGDRVERLGDRLVIVGRDASSIINVGGLKVSVPVVEEALLRHPDVAWCRVYARASSLVGAMVAADVVMRTPGERAEAEATLARHAAARLPEHAVPRLIRILDEIPMTGNRKSEVA